jgi:hypothetical protein
VAFEYASIVANSAAITSVSCTVFMWLLASGYVIFFSALFSKTHRIYRIFTNKSMQTKGFSDWAVARIIIAAVVVEIILLLCATLIQVPEARYLVDPSDPFTAVAQCTYFPTMIYILLVYKAAITLAGVVLAVLIRNIKHDFFNEAPLLGLCIYNAGFLAVVCVPAVAFVSQPTVRFVIMNVGIFLMSTISLIVMFARRIRLLARFSEEQLLSKFKSQSSRTKNGTTTDGSGSLNIISTASSSTRPN